MRASKTKIRASKENAEKYLQLFKRISASHNMSTFEARLEKYESEIITFFKAAKAKLPTEKAYDDDAKRRKEVSENHYEVQEGYWMKRVPGSDLYWKEKGIRLGHIQKRSHGWVLYDDENQVLDYLQPENPQISRKSAAVFMRNKILLDLQANE